MLKKKGSIILCGLPRCGKTTFGAALAKRILWNFIDTDRCVEEKYLLQTGQKRTCREIYLQEGALRFRELEREQILSLNPSERNVISLGGGSLNDPQNRKALKPLGTVVYLKTPLTLVWRRLHKNGLPAFLEDENTFLKMAKSRIPLYEEASDITIETSWKGVEDNINLLLEALYGT